MFTGIIKDIGQVVRREEEGSNIHFTLSAGIGPELGIDESVAHNGVCLTVVAVDGREYTVTAVEETLQKTNLSHLSLGDWVNLERAMILGSRLDGHMVQGHVDMTGTCVSVMPRDGSWHFHFEYPTHPDFVLVDKGSICINGVSLTVVAPQEGQFSVAIIPYTFEHTGFRYLRPGDRVNLEFDVLGKYIAQYMRAYAGHWLGKN